MLSPPSTDLSLDLDALVSSGSATYFRTQITKIEKQIVYASVSREQPFNAVQSVDHHVDHHPLKYVLQKRAAFQKWPGGNLTISRTFTKDNMPATEWANIVTVGHPPCSRRSPGPAAGPCMRPVGTLIEPLATAPPLSRTNNRQENTCSAWTPAAAMETSEWPNCMILMANCLGIVWLRLCACLR